jgi:tetratricopeptide (TPR) repeat protein
MRIIIFLTLSLGSLIPLRAQLFDDPDFRPAAQQGLDQMYNLSFEAAGSTFYNLLQAHPDHPAPYFLLAFNRWWQTYLSITMPDYYGYIEDKLRKAEERLATIEDQPGYEEEYLFFKFMIHALDARAHAYRNQWWSAMNAAKRVVDPLESSLEYVGQAPEFYMLAGLYRYYVQTYHQAYPVVRPILAFFPDGDVEQGLADLEKASSTPNIGQVEAKYFLGTIYNDEIDRYAAGIRIARELASRYPRNTWFQNDYAHALLQGGEFTQSARILQDLIEGHQQQSGHASRNIDSKESRFTTYLMVRVYHNQGLLRMQGPSAYQAALDAFAQSNQMAKLAGVEEDFYLPANQLYIGMCHDYLGQRDPAIAAYRRVLDMEENARYRSRAKKYIENPPLKR